MLTAIGSTLSPFVAVLSLLVTGLPVQADALARSFANRSGLEIELELIDLGFAHDVPGRQDLSNHTPAERAERQRAQAKERKRRQRSR